MNEPDDPKTSVGPQNQNGSQLEIEVVVNKEIPIFKDKLKTLTGKVFSDAQIGPIVRHLVLATQHQITIRTTKSHIGPLPSPEVIGSYEEIYPGAASQLFKGLEAEQSHRHDWENKVLNADIEDGMRKDYQSVGVAALGLLLAGLCIWTGAPAVGAILAGAIVLGGAAIWFGREFFASHSKEGTQVKVGSNTKDNKSPKERNAANRKSKR